jgi:uncharacterized protein (TIGR03437 family)
MKLSTSFSFVIPLVVAALLLISFESHWRASGQTGVVTTISAASFSPTAPVAPESIVAAFGQRLATRTEVAATQPLPTQLAGTTVRVNGSLASLFFVSAGQVNFVIPPGASSGAASVTIASGDGSVSQGTVQIAAASPGVFTSNSDGQGAPAAVLLRVAANGAQTFETVARIDPLTGRFAPRPLDLGPDGERVFLILFLSGLRGAADANGDGNVRESARMVIGGSEVVPDFAGRQGALAGLDQMNAEIPRSLIGRGRVSLAVTAANFTTSNLAEIDIASRPSASAPQVSSYNPNNVLAGTDMTIAGNGFSGNPADNTARIGGVEAMISAATTQQLSVKVPYGVVAGPVSVRTQQGEGSSATPASVRTSISGVFEDTSQNPIAGVSVRLRSPVIAATTNSEGAFTLPDVPITGIGLLDIEPPASPPGLPYPSFTLRVENIRSNRDNLFDRPVSLESATGASLTVGTGSSNLAEEENAVAPDAPDGTIQSDGVIFDVPGNATAIFPNGATRGLITLTSIRNSRVPINKPPGVFSSTVVQITPFRVRLTPGGKLTFPNRDGLRAGSTATLYKFDQTPNSPTLGQFINVGAATVSANGQIVETSAGAITETSIYFVAVQRQTTTVIGRVFESNGVTPIRRATAGVRGQEAFTDGNGGFILREVPANVGDALTVSASVLRPNGRIDRALSSATRANIGGITNVGAILMPAPASNLPPLLSGLPASFTVTENIEARIGFRAVDPNPQQSVRVAAVGANFVTTQAGAAGQFLLILSPKTGQFGQYTITVTATDDLGLSRSIPIAVRVNRPPVANPQTVDVMRNTPKTITLTGSDPDGDLINFQVVNSPEIGKLSGIPPNLTYTPNDGASGPDSFLFQVNDGFADSVTTARVAITISPPLNRAPTVTVPGTQTIQAGGTLNFTVQGTDPDAGQTLTLTATGLPQGASFTTQGTSPVVGAFTWRTPAGATGTFTITFTVMDNGTPRLSDSKSVTIRVTSPG